jgi:hypothetical protein
MNSNELDKLNLDLKQFFDFDNHPHVYHVSISKANFSFRESRSAATYADIAARFEAAIEWIKAVMKEDNESSCCPECGSPKSQIVRLLSFGVITDDEVVLQWQYDDVTWSQMIRQLEAAIAQLRQLSELPEPCKKCGKRVQKPCLRSVC